MAWAMEGDSQKMVVSLSRNGGRLICGDAKHEFVPVAMDHCYTEGVDVAGICSRISKAKCSWSIASTLDDAIDYDPTTIGLSERVRAAPDAPHGSISFYGSSGDLVGMTFVLPPPMLANVTAMMETVLLNPDLVYRLSADFLTFRAPQATTQTPTLQEFMAGKPYFFDRFYLSYCRKRPDSGF